MAGHVLVFGGDDHRNQGAMTTATVSEDEVLDALENEAIAILRETAAAFKKPVLMYSIGKDSSVLLHLLAQGVLPAGLPYPCLHVDSQWEFAEVIAHRDRMAREIGFELIVAQNDEGIAPGCEPDVSRHPRIHPNHAHRAFARGTRARAVRRRHRRWAT